MTDSTSSLQQHIIRVLVIDDEAMQFRLIEGFLATSTIAGYEVSWAESPSDALAYINENACDVCLLDYNLGGEDGLQLLEMITGMDDAPPVIFMTGRGSIEVDMQAMALGAIEYLNKTDLKPDLLERTIRYAVQRHIAQQRRLAAEQQQRIIAEALLDAFTAINSSLDLSEIILRILDNVGKVVSHDSANIMLIQGDQAYIAAHIGYETSLGAMKIRISDVPNFMVMQMQQTPVLIPDTEADDNWVSLNAIASVRSYVGVPIVVDNTVIGFLNLECNEPNFFTEDSVRYLQLFSFQASVALRNAQSFEQAQELASLEERERLARDLHDTVSQMLFSASMIADSLSRLAESDGKVAEGINKLKELNRGALAEMRSLLFELRPQSILSTDLNVLVKNLTSSLSSRSAIEILYEVDAEGKLPDEVHVAIYRILQEALNNIIKHARASMVEVKIYQRPDDLILSVIDDGVGFDVDEAHIGHYGLGIMRERAEKIDAKFEIHSAQDEGTILLVKWEQKSRL